MSSIETLERLKKPNKNDFFILDIDSTLVTTHQRNQAILSEWVQNHRTTYPEDCKQLSTAQCEFGDYGLVNALERIQFREINPGSYELLQEFWRTHFFSNKFLHVDVPTRGAVHWVQELEERGIGFCYLTARHHKAMWEGTLSSLDKMGFPIDETLLYLKKDLQQADEEYKAVQMEKVLLEHAEKSIWFIDNEPVVLNRIHQEFPQVHLVWFESTHSGRMQPPVGVTRISDFRFP
jgi:hypothetical protein